MYKMDGISEELNKQIDEEVMIEKLRKQAKKIIDTRRPITRAKIQELKELRQIEKDFE
jgi:ATP-dependent Zn protease